MAYAVEPFELEVPQGYPHGDAWGRVMHPNAPVSHDVERYLKKSKKERS